MIFQSIVRKCKVKSEWDFSSDYMLLAHTPKSSQGPIGPLADGGWGASRGGLTSPVGGPVEVGGSGSRSAQG